MPSAPLKPCADRRCPELVPKGTSRCPKHQSAYYRRQDEARPKGRQKRFGRRWQKVRRIVLARDPLCKKCNRAAATEADHVVPVEQGGAVYDTANLQGLCKSCHSRKTASEVLNG
jgi:5-methylcytosine-specific restriction protein A